MARFLYLSLVESVILANGSILMFEFSGVLFLQMTRFLQDFFNYVSVIDLFNHIKSHLNFSNVANIFFSAYTFPRTSG